MDNYKYALVDPAEGLASLETYSRLADATTRQISEPDLVLLQQGPDGAWLDFHTGQPWEVG